MTPRRFELAATIAAAALLAFAGATLWRKNPEPPIHAREVTVAWRCSSEDGGTCRVVSEVETCTTCHFANEERKHTHEGTLINEHGELGCVACHGGKNGTTRAAAHEGLARLGHAAGEVPEVQGRCASCHAETAPRVQSAAKIAWASFVALRDGKPAITNAHANADGDLAPTLTEGRALFRSLRCGACHATANEDAAVMATPLDTLGLRSGVSALSRSLLDHAAHSSVDLHLDEIGAASIAAHLVSIANDGAEAAMQNRAKAPGASADEGRVLYEKLACGACHDKTDDPTRIHVDLAPIASTRTADWVAYFLVDPAKANATAMMPSLRLSRREAASLAQHLITHAASDGIPSDKSDAGKALVAAGNCAACHHEASGATRIGPSLARYGESHDGAVAKSKLVDHVGFRLDDARQRALATFLVSQRPSNARPDLRVPASEGAAIFSERGCGGCHALDDVADARGPSLFGEGLRVQPQWLFDFLRAPEKHAIRPRNHPELAYRELVPSDHVAMRMPSYALSESDVTALVRFFSERDGASFPYGSATSPALSGDALTAALADYTHKDRGACTSCHTITMPDVARARENDHLAPPLSLAHDRLRPAWIEAAILQPSIWISTMPAMDGVTLERATRLRELVMSLRERSVLPAAGAEGTVPALGLGDL